MSLSKEAEAQRIFDFLVQKYYGGKFPHYKIMFDEKSAQGRTDPENLTIHMMENFPQLANLRESNFEDALKHEMVHAELHRKGLSDWGKHGEYFDKEAKRIGAPHWEQDWLSRV